MRERNKKLWIYNAGMSFSGNPKWMFMYMQKEHPEVMGVWLCYDRKTRDYIKNLGYKACLFSSEKGKRYMEQAGVYVVNQVKEVIQPELKGITMLNLWHGVGCKTVEQKVNFGFLQERIFKKYIQNNGFYRNNQLFLVTSPLMEEHFIGQCGLQEGQLVRAGYPCCMPMPWVKSYDHDIRKSKGLSKDTRIIMYCPTYRDGNALDFFGKAIPDMDRLIGLLQKKNMLLIFKMHPQMDKDYGYNKCKQQYQSCPNLLFWDNKNDIYEIFNQIDTAIIDYSSIFYDLLAAGVKHFVRYMFDLNDENNLRDFVFDVKEMTCGALCESFQELVETLDKDQAMEEIGDIERIKHIFWDYAEETPEKIYEAAMEYVPPLEYDKKTLYSFDIFDTLIQRKCLSPIGVFTYVKQKMYLSDVKFPKFLMENYRNVRAWCESNVREYYKKTLELRGGERLEISFDEIFNRMAELYGLDEEQLMLLKQWELEGEYEACIPVKSNINKVKQLLSENNTVVLISDMYLPKEFIKKLLVKADESLGRIPIFVSSDYGVQKTTRKLFLKVFESMDCYDFTEWIHFGDNENADGKMPRALGIKTEKHAVLTWTKYEQDYLGKNPAYDSYRCAAQMRRFKESHKVLPGDSQGVIEKKQREEFAYCYVSTWLVPYVAWAVKDAVSKGIGCLYFISRDGHHLKKIADEIICAKGYEIKTKYIYGSRRAWRIPSYVTDIDKDFFSVHGNIAEVKDYHMLLDAMHIEHEDFQRIFPALAYLSNGRYIPSGKLDEIRRISENSTEYREYLLEKGRAERDIVLKYLRQEIDFSESFAFVEYWGRGYTQDCLKRLLEEADGRAKEMDDIFYYLRSIYFSEGNTVRRNFLNVSVPLIMVEAVFANMPYKSVSGYEYNSEGIIVPVMKDNKKYDKALFEAMEKYLPQFAKDIYGDTLVDEDDFNVSLTRFGLEYYKNNKKDPVFVQVLAKLRDSVAIYGKNQEFAPAISMKDVYLKLRYNEYIRTRSIELSLIRSNRFYKTLFKMYRRWKDEK